MSDLDDAARLSDIFHGDGQAIAVLAMEHASILQQFAHAVAQSHPAPAQLLASFRELRRAAPADDSAETPTDAVAAARSFAKEMADSLERELETRTQDDSA